MRVPNALVFLPLLSLGCAAASSEYEATCQWNGTVQVHGALHTMFQEGQTGAVVNLESVLPNPNLYGVGALADLAGEVTIVAGMAYLSYPSGPQQTRTEVVSQTTTGAALLVAAEVEAWREVRIKRTIRFEDLDREIPRLAALAGVQTDARFPFLLAGEFEDLQWHVIDGRRLAGGGTSRGDHLEASVRATVDRASATLIGFFSATDQGVFTHMGSKTHLHCVLGDPVTSGHVDNVIIPAGTTVRFPTGVNPRLESVQRHRP